MLDLYVLIVIERSSHGDLLRAWDLQTKVFSYGEKFAHYCTVTSDKRTPVAGKV
jgi:hypothetical protein